MEQSSRVALTSQSLVAHLRWEMLGRDLMEEQGRELMESREADREAEKLMGSTLVFSPGTAFI